MSQVHHEPYIAPKSSMRELTVKAVLLGIYFGLLFGATTSYLALKVGLTVSASIPIAVMAIALFKKFGNATILENNIVQTVGSAGESVAAGVAFTLPALLFFSEGREYFHTMQIFILSCIGGMLGVLFMIPLRKTLVVEEHGRLPFPEGTACADILIAGEAGGGLARKVYWGIGVGFFYKTLMSIVGLWREIPSYIFSKSSSLPNGRLALEVSPELLGVGYIIGPRIGAILLAGGVLSALVLTPLITYVGEFSSGSIAAMNPTQIWSQYIRYIGAGAVTLSGVVALIRSLPMILRACKTTYLQLRKGNAALKSEAVRTDQDLPLSLVAVGIALLFALLLILPHIPMTVSSAILILLAGFFFVTVSSRIAGLIGLSSTPISGMTIATLMATSLIFITQGWTTASYQPIALCVGAIVAIAAANAGATAQDLKTGFLVGATPYKQQIGIMVGVLASACAVGFTIILLSEHIGIGEATELHPNPLPAPQAMLMSTLVKGLFDQSLPWPLVFAGMGIAAVVELCGIPSLPFAVGTYLPLSTSASVFAGGMIKWLSRRYKSMKAQHTELETGVLFSSGLIAGGSIAGILVALFLGITIDSEGKEVPLMQAVNTHLGDTLGLSGDLVALSCFALLCAALFRFATQNK